MLKLDLRPTVLEHSAGSKVDLECAPRLVVLVPSDIDQSVAPRRIWELANTAGINILLLGLCTDAAETSRLRRELITMASLLHDGKIAVEVKVEMGANWLDIVKTNCKADDVIVCFAEQRSGLLHRPLGQMLESNFNSTVYILSGLVPQTSKSNKRFQTSAWLGSIVIVIAFSLLQSNFVQLKEGWLQSALLILSIVPEFWLIWIWNSLFR